MYTSRQSAAVLIKTDKIMSDLPLIILTGTKIIVLKQKSLEKVACLQKKSLEKVYYKITIKSCWRCPIFLDARYQSRTLIPAYYVFAG